MELKIKDYQLPSAILFNFEELKAEIAERARVYETLVYTDDKIKEAKADKANLNKLKKALNDERIRREKEYMAPFKEFKTKVDEIIEIIDRPIGIIDKQVKEYEEAKKAAKKKEILAYMATFDMPHGIDLFKIFDPKWLNATVSMASVKAAIIHKNYKFWPINYYYYELLTGDTRFADKYTAEDKAKLDMYLQGQIEKVDLPNRDDAFCRTKILEMYANPVINYIKAIEE